MLKDVEGDMINTLLDGTISNKMKILRKIHKFVILVLNEIVEKMIWKYQIQINYGKS